MAQVTLQPSRAAATIAKAAMGKLTKELSVPHAESGAENAEGLPDDSMGVHEFLQARKMGLSGASAGGSVPRIGDQSQGSLGQTSKDATV